MSALILGLLSLSTSVPAGSEPLLGVALAAAFAFALLGCGIASPSPGPHVQVDRVLDSGGAPHAFTLTLNGESITLESGRPWTKVDVFKWVTRGLIESPQSYHVLPDGTVEINGERIRLTDAEACAHLEREINKRHVSAARPLALPTAASAAPAEPPPTHVVFHVKLDHLGHLLIQCRRGTEQAETGMRGLANLVQNGFLLPPRSVHVDPLQRALDLDDVRFPCSPEGALQLEAYLNQHYAPSLQEESESMVHVQESSASPTGFDVTFSARQSGQRLEVKGHLLQDKLDLLQDSTHCDLLQPGVVLRLTPPHLLFRRKQRDTSEAPIPELPDVHYRRITAAELQRMLNHPAIRRSGTAEALPPPPSAAETAATNRLEQIRVTRNPTNRALLWMELRRPDGATQSKAFTHHNVAELQHRGVFRSGLEIALSLDNHRLSILNRESRHDESLHLAADSDESELAKAGEWLTGALRTS